MSEFDIMKGILEKTGIYQVEEETVLYAELMAYAEGLDIFFEELAELERECFAATADSYGLTLRENMLRRVNFNSSIDGRRRRLLKALSIGCNDFNYEGMEKLRDSFNITGEFVFSPTDLKITFNCFELMSESRRKEFEESMRELMPAWTDFEVVLTL